MTFLEELGTAQEKTWLDVGDDMDSFFRLRTIHDSLPLGDRSKLRLSCVRQVAALCPVEVWELWALLVIKCSLSCASDSFVIYDVYKCVLVDSQSTSALCHSVEVDCTVLPTEQFRSSAFCCCRSVDLTFTAWQPLWCTAESQHFQTSTEDIHFYEILTTKCTKCIRDFLSMHYINLHLT